MADHNPGRAGVRALALLENPLVAEILGAHVDGPRRRAEVREAVGWAPESTVRAAVSRLCELGALRPLAPSGGLSGLRTAIAPPGWELLAVGSVLGAWLSGAAGGPLEPGGDRARVAVKALVGGWDTALMRALAEHPTSLVELSAALPAVNYPSLERRLGWMREVGQVEPAPSAGPRVRYRPTEWLRRGVAPLAAAARCERRSWPGESEPITAVEVEAAFLLALPLVTLPAGANGSCLLASRVEAGSGTGASRELAGVGVRVDRGRVGSVLAKVGDDPLTWAVGGPDAWLDAVLDGGIGNLRLGGRSVDLGRALVGGLHDALMCKS